MVCQGTQLPRKRCRALLRRHCRVGWFAVGMHCCCGCRWEIGKALPSVFAGSTQALLRMLAGNKACIAELVGRQWAGIAVCMAMFASCVCWQWAVIAACLANREGLPFGLLLGILRKRKLGQWPWAAKSNIGLSIDAWGGGRGCCGASFGHSLQGFLVHARA